MSERFRVWCGPLALLATGVLLAGGSAAVDAQATVSKKKARPVMQIKFVRSGGFAGAATNVAGTVQFDEQGAQVKGETGGYHRELNAQEAQQLRAAAEPSGLAKAGAAQSSPGATRDGYQYDITVVTKDGKSHTLTLGDTSPDALRKLAPGAAELGSWIQEEAQKIWSHRISTRK